VPTSPPRCSASTLIGLSIRIKLQVALSKKMNQNPLANLIDATAKL
jgi:hypothetical protein